MSRRSDGFSTAGANPRSAHSRLLEIGRATPALLLLAVALVQVHLAYGQGLLNPAKGGGFGLFSTVDRLNSRMTFLYLVDADGSSQPLPIDHLMTPGHPLRDLLLRARSLPTAANLSRAARALAARHPTKRGFSWRLEVWKQAFDSETGRLRRIRLASHDEKRDPS